MAIAIPLPVRRRLRSRAACRRCWRLFPRRSPWWSSISAACCGRCGSRSPARRCCPPSISSAWINTSACSATPASSSRSRTCRSSAPCSSIGCLVLGFLLAAFIDQRVRAEGTLRTIYLYPHAMSFIVTGLVWQWFLNPTLGLQKLMQDAGWQSFTFDWLVNKEMVVYTLVIAGDLAVGRADHGDPPGRASEGSTMTCGRRRGSTASRPGGSMSRSCCRSCGRC